VIVGDSGRLADVDYPNNLRGYSFDAFITTIDLGNLTTSDVVRYTMEVSVTGSGLETGGFARAPIRSISRGAARASPSERRSRSRGPPSCSESQEP
jgi:hypothetical protein